MKYWYKISDEIALRSEEEEDQYYTMAEVRTIRLYTRDEIHKGDPELYWPVHDPCGWSWEPGEYASMDDAYDDLCRSLNMGIYERLHDI